MKKPNNIAVLILALSLMNGAVCAAEPAKDDTAQAQAPKPYAFQSPKLHRAQVDALLAKPGELLVIDVRRPDEISAIGSFPVYLNIQAKELEAALPYIPKERTIITVSNHANRAGAAADFLAEKGFKVAGAVGSQNYEEEGGKIVKIAIPPKNGNTVADANGKSAQ